VPAKLAARVRVLSVGHGRKNDPDDAVSVAVAAARSAPQLRQVQAEDQVVVLHLLTNPPEGTDAQRRSAVEVGCSTSSPLGWCRCCRWGMAGG
jgi:hypothetical protein